MRGIVRIVAGIGIAVFACLACSGFGLFAVAGHAPNPHLSAFQSIALRFSLLSGDRALVTAVGGNPTPVKFVVHANDFPATIAANLMTAGLISDAKLFRDYVSFYGIDAKLQAGTYLLNQTQTIPQIAAALTNAGASTVTLQVIEGWRASQIAEAINANSLLGFSGSDFLATISSTVTPPDWFASVVTLPSGASLEGFLFPDTYLLPLNATASDLRDQMLKEFLAKVTPTMRADAAKTGLSVYQIVTLASIVEREAEVADERPLIAGVYLNRLNKPMTMDADPTIQYALGKTGAWWPSLTVDDYHNVQSPYNTYLHSGLPPTPIANPGISSINAAIYPRTSPYYYFRASCIADGRHKFAVTFAEQQANGC